MIYYLIFYIYFQSYVGINRAERGALAKCSFEETVEILFGAAAFAETDALQGVTENVIVGQLAKFGTGLCGILLDESKVW